MEPSEQRENRRETLLIKDRRRILLTSLFGSFPALRHVSSLRDVFPDF